MNAQDLSVLESDTPTLRVDSYLEHVLSNDVAGAGIMEYVDVLTLGRIRRASKTCAQAVTHIGSKRLQYYACAEWIALNYTDFCQPGTDVPGGAHIGLPKDVPLAIDNCRTWMQAWAKTWSCPQTKSMAEAFLDFDR
jgi:hypothetical protein